MKKSGQTFEFRSLNALWEHSEIPREKLGELIPCEAGVKNEELPRVHYRGKIILFSCLLRSDHLGLHCKLYVVSGPGLTLHELAKIALVQPAILLFLTARVEEVSMNTSGESLLKVTVGSDCPFHSERLPPVYFRIKDE